MNQEYEVKLERRDLRRLEDAEWRKSCSLRATCAAMMGESIDLII